MVLKVNTIVLNMILIFLCPVNLFGQLCEKYVFELYLIKYIKYRDQIQILIRASSKSQIQIQIRSIQIQIRKYKYVFDPIPANGCPQENLSFTPYRERCHQFGLFTLSLFLFKI